MISFTLPWPPSVNHYWAHTRRGCYVAKAGREYKGAALVAVNHARADRHLEGPLFVRIQAYPPDRRKRDVDNILKAVLDACTTAGVWQDDGQIISLHVYRHTPDGTARVVIAVEEDAIESPNGAIGAQP